MALVTVTDLRPQPPGGWVKGLVAWPDNVGQGVALDLRALVQPGAEQKWTLLVVTAVGACSQPVGIYDALIKVELTRAELIMAVDHLEERPDDNTPSHELCAAVRDFLGRSLPHQLTLRGMTVFVTVTESVQLDVDLFPTRPA